MRRNSDKFLKATAFTLLTSLLPGIASAAPDSRAYGVGHPFELADLPFGDIRTKLESLPAPARNKAMAWLNNFTFTTQDLPFLRIDETGGVFYADTYLPRETGTEAADGSEPGAPETALSASDVFSLHSRPGASRVLYLDFDGHLIPSTSAWTSINLDARPYDLDGSPVSFSDAELANIAEIWRRIAEDYAAFDVNVTTQLPASFGPTVGRILVTTDTDNNGNAMPAQGAGGVAYVNVWGRSDYASKYSPALVYFNRLGNGRADYVSEAASHEAGHNLSLGHDATSSSSYYSGHGSGNISWGPVMGTGYNRNVSQWSKGEYPDANNQQDDIAILNNKLVNRGDDHVDGLAGATRIVADAAGNISATTLEDDPDNLLADNKGNIESATDLDVFYFDTSGGQVDLAVTPAWQSRYTRGANLDIDAALYNEAGTLLYSSDSPSDTNSTLSVNLAAGRYYLAIQGVGSSTSPYSAYGSLGQYAISGLLPSFNDSVAPLPNPMSWELPPQASGRDSINMTATTANDDSGVVEYRFECIAGPAGCTTSSWQAGSSYTATGLLPGSTYDFTVSTRDAYQNVTAPSASVAAMTAANQSPTATDDSANTEEGNAVSINVLANDNDPEGDTLTVTASTQGINGSVANNGNSVSYTPNPGFTGNDNFSYSIDDGYNGTATANVSVSVSAGNSAPLANPDNVTIVKGDTVVISVLDNDSDPDGDALSITAVTSANKGVVSWQAGQDTITYAHNIKRKGSDSFSYTVSDGHGGTATGTVSITLGSSDSGGDSGTGGGGGNGKGKKPR
jgi:hypothetical protein